MATQYITSKGKRITVAQKIGSGAEGDVYRVQEAPNEALKVYKPEKRTPEQQRKLEAMIIKPPDDNTRSLSPPHVSIAWPTDIVYDSNTRSFVGFTMPIISKSPNIFEVYNPKLRAQSQPRVNWQHLHQTAKNFSIALSCLHGVGHIMGDVNQKNILVANNCLVTLVDTDSFQVTDSRSGQIHRCLVGVPEYTPPELQRQGVKFSSVERTIHHDYFGLAVIIFQLLMEGYHPYTGAPKNPMNSTMATTVDEQIKAGIFPYQPNRELNPPPNAPPFDALHPDIQQLFIQCFVQGHGNAKLRPTPYEWMNALEKAKNEQVQCWNNPSHWYSRHFGRCHWCEREQNKNQPPLPIQSPLPIPLSTLPKQPIPQQAQTIARPQQPLQPTKRIDLWGWLATVVGIYALIAFFSSPLNWGATMSLALAIGLALAVAWDVAKTGAWATALAVGWGAWVAFSLALADFLSSWLDDATFYVWLLLLALGFVGAGAWAGAWTWASEELRKSFSKFHTFLILAGTSLLGLGFGWVVYQIFPINIFVAF